MEKPNLDDKKYRYFHKKLGKIMVNNQKYWADCQKYAEYMKQQEAKIEWTGSPDDMTARINDYVLRVEQMDRYYWWWAVSYQGEEIATDGKQTKDQAKTACEKAYREHRDGKK